jgi:hypothetical protein
VVLHVIDVPSRTRVFQEVVTLSTGSITSVRGLPEQGAMVVGQQLGSASFPYDDTGDGYVVTRLDVALQ